MFYGQTIAKTEIQGSIFFAFVVKSAMDLNKKSKKWYEVVDFYKLTALVFLWVSSWLFMFPHDIDTKAPVFDNVWGAFFSVFGATKSEVSTAQQIPDLMSGAVAVLLMLILQLRGIFSVTTGFDGTEDSDVGGKDAGSFTPEKKTGRAGPLVVFLNILSILVHALFFSVLTKIFLFPNMAESFTVYEKMRQNMVVTVFTACSITGMVFGVPSFSKFCLLLFFGVGLFKNISFISASMGVLGFVAVLFAVVGFYLEFLAGGIDRRKLRADLSVLSGTYRNLYQDSLEDGKKVSSALSAVSGGVASAVVSGKKNRRKSLLRRADRKAAASVEGSENIFDPNKNHSRLEDGIDSE